MFSEVIRLKAKRPLIIRGLSRASLTNLGESLHVGFESIIRSELFSPALKAINHGGETADLPQTIEATISVGDRVRFRVEGFETDGVWGDPLWVGILSCESPYLADRISSQGLRRWFFGSRLVYRRETVLAPGKNGKQKQKKARSASMEEVLSRGFEFDPIKRAKLFLEVFYGDISLRPLFSWELKVSFVRGAGRYVCEDIKAIGTCVPISATTKTSRREMIGPGLIGAKVVVSLSAR